MKPSDVLIRHNKNKSFFISERGVEMDHLFDAECCNTVNRSVKSLQISSQFIRECLINGSSVQECLYRGNDVTDEGWKALRIAQTIDKTVEEYGVTIGAEWIVDSWRRINGYRIRMGYRNDGGDWEAYEIKCDKGLSYGKRTLMKVCSELDRDVGIRYELKNKALYIAEQLGEAEIVTAHKKDGKWLIFETWRGYPFHRMATEAEALKYENAYGDDEEHCYNSMKHMGIEVITRYLATKRTWLLIDFVNKNIGKLGGYEDFKTSQMTYRKDINL